MKTLKMDLKKSVYFFFVLFLCFVSFSCGHSNLSKELTAERDSLIKVNQQQNEALTEITSTIAQVSVTLDSIAKHEQILYSNRDIEGRVLSRKKILENLSFFENLLTEKSKEMKAMEESLSNKDGNIRKFQIMIDYLVNEIDKKNENIRVLRRELERKNGNISILTDKLSSLKNDVLTLNDTISMLQEKTETFSEQEKKINEVYYTIGTKKDLIARGLLSSRGLFAKKRIDYSSLDTSMFVKADMRFLKQLIIVGKEPQILTNVVSTSYTLTENGRDSYILKIIDSISFWSVSKYLIIQIK
ncbi:MULTISPECIES: hypothetical protein [Bacteroides]|jgi:hypothetical protein|uniref:Uncharacterized protein n=1 Tax=Bacteroides xylanisolvens TaxID=371601 RepID=A0A415KBX0_9BACE|nr:MULTISPECIES: hypothetical protein [Bacteroides]CAG9875255.1 hypothetical protein BOVAC2_2188 [Bacteroides ovatus]MCU4241566.1 hypothetical protein [Bacteroides xylanisolvens]RHF24237.1 hypothetical protein DW691_21435 [Bacteroides xylanisolvens]RHK91416.1 hypothetical protein DW042_20300 [Bacteroides xylanisolvens]RHL33725.1 hypothetical protein DW027_20985 [Bacteroides xylanisolvens]